MVKKKVERKIIRTEDDITPLDRQIINIVCYKCNFYHEEQEYYEEEYECVAYELIRQMLKDKTIILEKIEDLFKKIDLNPTRELKSGH
jgi:hypothetical protein